MTFSKKNHSTPLHSTHSTEPFKIFFSPLTLSTVFLQKASGPGKDTERYKETIKYLKRNNVTDDRIKNNNELIINHEINNGKNDILLIKEISENENVKDLNDNHSVIQLGVIKTSGGQ